MLKRMKPYLIAGFMVWGLSFAGLVMAQDTGGGLDLEQQLINMIAAVTPIGASVLTFFLRKGLDKIGAKIPRVFIPLIVAALGIGVDFFLSWAAGQPFTPVVGAIMGMVGVWLRELVDTFKEHGFSA